MTKTASSQRTAAFRHVLLASTLLCASGPLSAPAQAQSAGAAAPGVMEEIVVTGSRLSRPDLSAPSPIAVVGEEDLRTSGNVTIEHTLNQFPQLGGGQTSNVGNGGGAGILTANLRGLGNQRTLVLVNGRRFIPTGENGLVDLATIPDAIVRRVEIITGGASAVYGSDAVAGAVNFILKDDFEGAEGSYQYGATTKGDGISHKVDATVGTNFAGDRGNVVLSASYTDRSRVSGGARDFSKVAVNASGGQLVPSGSANVPGTRIGLSSAQLARVVGVNLTPPAGCTQVTGVYFAANGTPTPFCTPENTFNFASFSNLERPMTRYQVSALAHIDLTDNVEAYTELYGVNSRNVFEFSPDSFIPVTPGAASQTLIVPSYATNPGLLPAVRQFFANNTALFDPNRTGNATVVGSGRSTAELGPRKTNYESVSTAVTTGLRGDFDAMDNNWRWDTFFQYHRNRTDAEILNTVSQTRLGLGLDTVVNAQGQVVCRIQTLGCVPVSIFGFNSISPAAGAFITPPRRSDAVFKRRVAGGSLSGELFDLPAGPVAIATGVEYRKDSYDFDPSPMDLAGEYGAVSTNAVSGSYSVKEGFGEVRIPLLSGLAFVDSLAVEGAARYSDYSLGFDAFTWKAGGEYAPVEWMRVRSAYNRAIRAPSVGELYSPIGQGFQSGSDPCAVSQRPTDAQKQLCVAQGVPAADINTFQQAVLGFNVRSGGNPNLQPEKSNTWTVGAVISPPFLPRANFTVDYFNAKVKGGIASVNGAQTLSDCFANLSIQSPTCQAIRRLPNGQIDVISAQTTNLAGIKVNGVDTQVDYTLDLPDSLDLGDEGARLDLRAIAGWLFERSQQVIVSQPAVDCAGHFGNGCTATGTPGIPDFKVNLSGTYHSGPLSLRLEGRMLGSFYLYPGLVHPISKVGETWYFDMSTSYALAEGLEVFGGFNNIFDKQPPQLGNAIAGESNTSLGLWDVVGRRFFLGARVKL